MDFRELLRQISGPALPAALPRAVRYLTSASGVATEEEAAPGLIQKPDGTVWLVNPDGSQVQVAGGGSQPITDPTDLAGCVCWLDASQLALADDAPVATWPDLSGSGFDATQATADNRPVCKTNVQNGLRSVRFDPSAFSQYLMFSGAGLGLFRNRDGSTVAMLARILANAGTDYLLEASKAGSTSNSLSYEQQAFNVDNNGGSDATIVMNVPSLGLVAGVMSVDWLGGDVAVSVYPGSFDGGPRLDPPGPTPDTASQQIIIGADPGLTGITADIFEVIVYDRAVNASESRQLIEYLSAKWTPS